MRRLNKSISLAFTFALVITAAIIPFASNAEELRIGGSGTDLATIKQLAEKFTENKKNIKLIIPKSLGSSGGIKALRAGKLDIAITSRPLKQKEKSPHIRLFKYAQTALVFATSANNPVDEINTQQLKDIYSGIHPYWPNGTVARPILRPPSDSDTILVRRYLPAMAEPMKLASKRRGVPTAYTDQKSASKIESVPGAIGTSALSLILAEERPLKALNLNGIVPSIENITTGQYTMVKDLFIVIPSEPNELVKNFIRFMNSKQSIEILNRTGHRVISFSL